MLPVIARNKLIHRRTLEAHSLVHSLLPIEQQHNGGKKIKGKCNNLSAMHSRDVQTCTFYVNCEHCMERMYRLATHRTEIHIECILNFNIWINKCGSAEARLPYAVPPPALFHMAWFDCVYRFGLFASQQRKKKIGRTKTQLGKNASSTFAYVSDCFRENISITEKSTEK